MKHARRQGREEETNGVQDTRQRGNGVDTHVWKIEGNGLWDRGEKAPEKKQERKKRGGGKERKEKKKTRKRKLSQHA